MYIHTTIHKMSVTVNTFTPTLPPLQDKKSFKLNHNKMQATRVLTYPLII
uniref:Uncharacterized protein n=1 Tax=Anguilla anguilla TaxID=7936 RepID=A0A0E9R945_ANGAN